MIELLTGGAGFQQFAKVVALENVAVVVIRVAGDPAIALRYLTTRVDGNQGIGAVLAPDAR